MPTEQIQQGSNVLFQYGALGVVAAAAIFGLGWLVYWLTKRVEKSQEAYTGKLETITSSCTNAMNEHSASLREHTQMLRKNTETTQAALDAVRHIPCIFDQERERRRG